VRESWRVKAGVGHFDYWRTVPSRLRRRKELFYVCLFVCLSVCLSVC